MKTLISTIEFNSLGDERGGLVSLEANENIPFSIKRVYYIFGSKAGIARGFHAHKKLKQVAIAVSGSCRFIIDDGQFKESKVLSSPTEGLLIDSCVWREMHDFSHDCVLMVLASDYYDEADYIRNYQDFLKIMRK
ncbi:sugar 3,4-ketoisomerase [Shewanella baltica]|uniref:sugar 3,4-ketoisomerase n=1 Tax=Shewanella baltica TaxID=62322 RepID=UPI003D7C06A4